MVKWTRGVVLYITLAKDGWRFPKLSGILVMKCKKGQSVGIYIAVKIDGKVKKVQAPLPDKRSNGLKALLHEFTSRFSCKSTP
ncbi:hypothetical protein H5T51_06850 [Candidatus Bathyarchaeota archaeon]|nr:hypothetical protein [Candidatus Bathyarchaeota archaeon]